MGYRRRGLQVDSSQVMSRSSSYSSIIISVIKSCAHYAVYHLFRSQPPSASSFCVSRFASLQISLPLLTPTFNAASNRKNLINKRLM